MGFDRKERCAITDLITFFQMEDLLMVNDRIVFFIYDILRYFFHFATKMEETFKLYAIKENTSTKKNFLTRPIYFSFVTVESSSVIKQLAQT